MSDNVNVKFGADATKMAKEFERMRDKIASLTNTVEKLTEKSKKGGKAGKDAYKGMGDELASFAKNALGVTAIYAAITRGISAVIEKTKELRALRDESAISTSASLNKINKEYKLEGTDQDRMQNWIQGASQSKKMKMNRLAELVAAGANEGISKEDFYSGKMGSVIDLLNVNEKLTGEQAINITQTGLQKSGKSFKDFKKTDIDKVSNFYATMGGDVATADMELAQLDKRIPFEEAVVLIDAAKKNRYGKGKKSASDINEGYKKGGMRAAIKSAGYENEQQFYDDLSTARKDSETILPTQSRIQKSSREAEVIYSENKKQFVFEEAQRGEKLDVALKNERLAKEELDKTNYAKRATNSAIGNMYGEENVEPVNSFVKETFTYGTAPGLILKLIDVVKGTGENIDKKNTMDQKQLAKKPIEKNDSKGVR